MELAGRGSVWRTGNGERWPPLIEGKSLGFWDRQGCFPLQGIGKNGSDLQCKSQSQVPDVAGSHQEEPQT